MRKFVLLVIAMLLPVTAAAQTSPCDTPLETRVLFPSTAQQVPAALLSPDHANADKVSEYQINVYTPGNLTTPLVTQVVAKSAVTPVPGTTNCYLAMVTRTAALTTDTDYVLRATVRGPAGEADLTQPSNPFVFPSRPVLTGVRVPRP